MTRPETEEALRLALEIVDTYEEADDPFAPHEYRLARALLAAEEGEREKDAEIERLREELNAAIQHAERLRMKTEAEIERLRVKVGEYNLRMLALGGGSDAVPS